MSFLLASAARATTGARSGQEDAFRLWPAEGVARPKAADGGLLAVLADGMGGHTGGAVAGQTACSTFADVFADNSLPYDQRLETALHASNEALAKGVEQNAALRGMGCTLIGAWMDDLGIRWTSVGDSLLLLYRFPDVIRLNADHSLGSFLDEQARQNRISVAEAKQHHNRNALRSALTGSKIDLIDLRREPLELSAGDWILLASDGICSLEGDEIADVVYNYRQSTPAEMAQGLIDAVLKKGVAGQDNTTVVAVRIDEAPAADEASTRPVRRGDDDPELRSRRIGITGRKTAVRRPGRRTIRSVLWLAAAAMFFLFFAATVLLRSMQSTTPTPEAAIPVKPQPAAVAAPEPKTPNAKPSAPDVPQPPGPPAVEPATPPLPKSATPDPSGPVGLPPVSKSGPSTVPKQPVAPPQQATTPAPPPPLTAPSDPQPAPPASSPGSQSGEVQGERSERTNLKQQGEKQQGEKQRARRQDQQAKEGAKENANKPSPKSTPKEQPKQAPSGGALPWGFQQ
jgi:serine/threonine protein phosphatase PrpC